MKKYQKQKWMKHLTKQNEEGLLRKKKTIEKGIQYYKTVDEKINESSFLS